MKICSLVVLLVIFFAGCGQPATPRFTPIILTDKKTDLMWYQEYTYPRPAINYEKTNAYCNDSLFGGYSNWRLPSIQELVSLIDYSKYPKNSATNSNFKLGFESIIGVKAAYYDNLMSSTLDSKGWYLSLMIHSGETKAFDISKDFVSRFLCVRGKKKAIY